MATADGYVLPKPGIPKTLGILSVIFSVILILIGICGLGSLLAAPALMQFAQTTVKVGQEKVESQQKSQLKTLEDREKAATTDEEKATIKAERDAVVNQPKPPVVDISAVTDMVRDPTVMGFSYFTYGTGLLLHIMLMVAGIGLIRLTAWGRSLAVTWAGLQIAQLLVVTALNYYYVLPITRANQEKVLAKMEADVKKGGAATPANAGANAGLQMAKAMEGFTGPLVIGQLLAGSTFPVILMIMLNGAGARAACRAGKPPRGPGEFGTDFDPR